MSSLHQEPEVKKLAAEVIPELSKAHGQMMGGMIVGFWLIAYAQVMALLNPQPELYADEQGTTVESLQISSAVFAVFCLFFPFLMVYDLAAVST